MSIRPQGKFIKQHKHTSRRQNNTVCNGRRHTIGVVTIQQFLTTSIILLNDPTAMICSHKHKMSRQIAETNLHYQPEAEEPLKQHVPHDMPSIHPPDSVDEYPSR